MPLEKEKKGIDTMKVKLISYEPVTKEIEIPDRFKPIAESEDGFIEEMWDDFCEYLDNNPEINAVSSGAIETMDGLLIGEW